MASHSSETKTRRARRQRNAGQDRKKKAGKRSTLSAAELFAKCGEPGKPAPTESSAN